MNSLRVVVTGSECTGKTTLARTLAERYQASFVPEYVRAYADQKGDSLGPNDVQVIMEGQIASHEAALREAARLVVFDTDLVSTWIYARQYYSIEPTLLRDEAIRRRGDLYLLCDIDVPWVADGQRDRPTRRAEMQRLFEEALSAIGANVTRVRGSAAERVTTAAQAIDHELTLRAGTGPRVVS